MSSDIAKCADGDLDLATSLAQGETKQEDKHSDSEVELLQGPELEAEASEPESSGEDSSSEASIASDEEDLRDEEITSESIPDKIWDEPEGNFHYSEHTSSTKNRTLEKFLGNPVLSFKQRVSPRFMKTVRKDLKRSGDDYARRIRADGAVIIPHVFETENGGLRYALARPQRILKSSEGNRIAVEQRGTKGRERGDAIAFLTMDKLVAYVPAAIARDSRVLAVSPCEKFPLGSVLVDLTLKLTEEKFFNFQDDPFDEFFLFRTAYSLRNASKKLFPNNPMEIVFDVMPPWEFDPKKLMSREEREFIRQTRTGCLPDSLEVEVSSSFLREKLVETLRDQGEQDLANYFNDLNDLDFQRNMEILKERSPEFFACAAESIGAPTTYDLHNEAKNRLERSRDSALDASQKDLFEETEGAIQLNFDLPTLSSELNLTPLGVAEARDLILSGDSIHTYKNSSPFLTECMSVVSRQMLSGRAKLLFAEVSGQVTTLLASARPNRNFEPFIGGKMPQGVRWQEEKDVEFRIPMWIPIPTLSSENVDVMYLREVIATMLFELITGNLEPGLIVTFQSSIFCNKTLNYQATRIQVPSSDLDFGVGIDFDEPSKRGVMFQILYDDPDGRGWLLGESSLPMKIHHPLDVRTKLPNSVRNLRLLYQNRKIGISGLVPPRCPDLGFLSLYIRTDKGIKNFPIPEDPLNGVALLKEDFRVCEPRHIYDKITKSGTKHPSLAREGEPVPLLEIKSLQRDRKNSAKVSFSEVVKTSYIPGRTEASDLEASDIGEPVTFYDAEESASETLFNKRFLTKASSSSEAEKKVSASFYVADLTRSAQKKIAFSWGGIWKTVPKNSRNSLRLSLSYAIYHGKCLRNCLDNCELDEAKAIRKFYPKDIFQGFHVNFLVDAFNNNKKVANQVSVPTSGVDRNFKDPTRPPW